MEQIVYIALFTAGQRDLILSAVDRSKAASVHAHAVLSDAIPKILPAGDAPLSEQIARLRATLADTAPQAPRGRCPLLDAFVDGLDLDGTLGHYLRGFLDGSDDPSRREARFRYLASPIAGHCVPGGEGSLALREGRYADLVAMLEAPVPSPPPPQYDKYGWVASYSVPVNFEAKQFGARAMRLADTDRVTASRWLGLACATLGIYQGGADGSANNRRTAATMMTAALAAK